MKGESFLTKYQTSQREKRVTCQLYEKFKISETTDTFE